MRSSESKDPRTLVIPRARWKLSRADSYLSNEPKGEEMHLTITKLMSFFIKLKSARGLEDKSQKER